MPRFSLRDVFWCVTLLTLGVAGFGWVLRDKDSSEMTILLVFAPSLGAFGAGVGALFQRKLRGAIIAWGLGILVFVVGSLILTAAWGS